MDLARAGAAGTTPNKKSCSAAAPTACDLLSLPDILLLVILGHLSVPDLCQVHRVCSYFSIRRFGADTEKLRTRLNPRARAEYRAWARTVRFSLPALSCMQLE